MYYLQNICFLCLARGQNLASLINIGPSIQKMLKSIVPEHAIRKSGPPSKICDNCSSSLNNIYKFRQKCLRNIKIFNGYMQKLIQKNDSYKCLSIRITDILLNEESAITEGVEQIRDEIDSGEELQNSIFESDHYTSGTKVKSEKMTEQIRESYYEDSNIGFHIKKEINEELIIEEDLEEDWIIFENSVPENAQIYDLTQEENLQNNGMYENLFLIKEDKQLEYSPENDDNDSESSNDQKSNSLLTERHRQFGGPKTWTQKNMEFALGALRNRNMGVTKASATYGIPVTTLWKRARRLGIDTPKKEDLWTKNLNSALDAIRTGTISANKASKVYGIPRSSLYKIARRKGIRLAASFKMAPTTWSQEDLERALNAIRCGQTSVSEASTKFGIPTGTLYGRCKREGIELIRSNQTWWSEDVMGEALEAVRVGQMSINQAANQYNLPYSSLYGRFKRGKYDTEPGD